MRGWYYYRVCYIGWDFIGCKLGMCILKTISYELKSPSCR